MTMRVAEISVIYLLTQHAEFDNEPLTATDNTAKSAKKFVRNTEL